MCGEWPGKNFGQRSYVQRSNMVVAARWCEDAWQHQEWEIFILSQAAWTNTMTSTFFEYIWQPVLNNLDSRKFCISPWQWPKTFFTFVKGWCFYNCPNTLFLYFCTLNQQIHTIISQIITLLHVSTLSCHPQSVMNTLPSYTSISKVAFGNTIYN
jgi:hypothetical protein